MSEQTPSPGPRVLVVDDSVVIRQAIKKMLGGEFDVVLAKDGEAGWEALMADGDIKAMITDIEMPRLDGYGLLCRLRAADADRIRDLPVIAITGAEDQQTKARAYACGATDFITKPLDKLQLLARVHAYVRYDQTARDLLEKTEALEADAIGDPLTGLRSRRYFFQRGEQDLSQAERHGGEVAVLRLDIDDFKRLYGEVGDDGVDALLVKLAQVLNGLARAEDTIARVGGAEFAVLAPATNIAQATSLGERILVALRATAFEHGGRAVKLSVSVGVAAYPQDSAKAMDDLVRLAERRMNHAKSEGGDRVAASVLGEAIPEPEEVMLAPAVAGIDDARDVSPAVAPSADFAPAALVSIDKALALIARGEFAAVLPYLPQLLRDLQPLLAFAQAQEKTQGALERTSGLPH